MNRPLHLLLSLLFFASLAISLSVSTRADTTCATNKVDCQSLEEWLKKKKRG